MASEEIVLKNKSSIGTPLEVHFAPHRGMNMTSFMWGEHQLLDLSTTILFDQRGAGLGALIGPHFHHRKKEAIVPVEDVALFPHLFQSQEQGIIEPFSHGIARYVPWQVVSKNDTEIQAVLSSNFLWKGKAYGALEGMTFEMLLYIQLQETGLSIHYSITSQKPSVVGLHYYYALNPEGKNFITSKVAPFYFDQGLKRMISDKFDYDKEAGTFSFDLNNEIDYGFRPIKLGYNGEVYLNRPDYKLGIFFLRPLKIIQYKSTTLKGLLTYVLNLYQLQIQESQPPASMGSLPVLL